jgi:DNA-binding CsgD family transcriptional regulator
VALRLHGLLAAVDGDAVRASAIFAAGRGDPRAGVAPYRLAQLEVAAGRGLRLLAQRPEAIGWLREARGRLVRLGAAPAIGACDQELAACGVQTGREVSAATLGLTPTELAVASLVAAGRSNRQAAAELYVSIKGIEFHLRNIFAKLGIRSRKDLADRLGDDADVMTLA